ncbi:PREDICTED: ubiquitin-conjugating enzyme E2 U-like [Acropora digitifera]|uniref:ubiquitin-conjugating enzyme E2 U-like n=1 Tax=Acropora digitifera TaxID=70779 RepID=UPI00077A2420|nr:PREDICTED: ubiquitin-conjugating enzyme E2 U-like [Acropora digitifera]
MHSRAYLLLEKERFKLQKENLPWGIQAKPLNEDDMFTWEGSIKGPKDTMWEGGIFKLYLQFNEQYNAQPPRIFFHTIPFHPNVDPTTGQICADFLDDMHSWKEFYSIPYMLLSVQMLLSNPVIENAVNPNAAQIFATSPTSFRQMVLDCVLASKRVSSDRTSSVQWNCRCISQNASIGKVSFEDYHAMWSGMATTKPMANVRSPLHAVLSADSNLRAAHFGLPQQELKEEINKQLEEHNSIMYGKFEKSGQNIAELKSNKMQLLRRVYLPKQQEALLSNDSPSQGTVPSSPSPAMTARNLDPREHEVDELLSWTNSLPWQ